jgi:hypothetical protein
MNGPGRRWRCNEPAVGNGGSPQQTACWRLRDRVTGRSLEGTINDAETRSAGFARTCSGGRNTADTRSRHSHGSAAVGARLCPGALHCRPRGRGFTSPVGRQPDFPCGVHSVWPRPPGCPPGQGRDRVHRSGFARRSVADCRACPRQPRCYRQVAQLQAHEPSVVGFWTRPSRHLVLYPSSMTEEGT